MLRIEDAGELRRRGLKTDHGSEDGERKWKKWSNEAN
jgi:hypothetical protein